MKLQTAKISFPEIRLHPHYGHKLRGYIGNLFKEKSPLLHNHLEGGGLRYSYPLVQYKIIDSVPILFGLGEGAELLIDLFLRIKELDLYDKKFVIYSKNIENHLTDIRITDSLIEYNFETLWMGLNQSNYNKYNRLLPGDERNAFLNKILIGNILSFYKGIGFRAEERIYAKVDLTEKLTLFKNNKMTVFSGRFVSNAQIPNFAGLGKAVARGFGAVSDHPNSLS